MERGHTLHGTPKQVVASLRWIWGSRRPVKLMTSPTQDFRQAWLVSLTMSEAKKPPVFLNLVILPDIDLQNAYGVAMEYAKEKSITFNGIYPWNLGTSPPSFAQSISFVVDMSEINEVFAEMLKRLRVPKAMTKLAVNPAPQAVPEKPMPEGIVR